MQPIGWCHLIKTMALALPILGRPFCSPRNCPSKTTNMYWCCQNFQNVQKKIKIGINPNTSENLRMLPNFGKIFVGYKPNSP